MDFMVRTIIPNPFNERQRPQAIQPDILQAGDEGVSRDIMKQINTRGGKLGEGFGGGRLAELEEIKSRDRRGRGSFGSIEISGRAGGFDDLVPQANQLGLRFRNGKGEQEGNGAGDLASTRRSMELHNKTINDGENEHKRRRRVE